VLLREPNPLGKDAILAGLATHPGQVERHCRERAADVVVDFACDPAALGFLGALDVQRQAAKLLARFAQFQFRLLLPRDVESDPFPPRETGGEFARTGADGNPARGVAQAAFPVQHFQARCAVEQV